MQGPAKPRSPVRLRMVSPLHFFILKSPFKKGFLVREIITQRPLQHLFLLILLTHPFMLFIEIHVETLISDGEMQLQPEVTLAEEARLSYQDLDLYQAYQAPA